MNEEDLKKFKNQNITYKVITDLEAELHTSMRVVDDINHKNRLKKYQMAVYCMREENTDLKQELQQKDEVIDEAIKYLESYMPSYDFDHSNIQKAIDILKGDNNE